MPSFAKPVCVVFDTNVIASALLWGGTPERLIEAAEIVAHYREIAETVEAASIEETQLRDPDDAAALACALAARAEATRRPCPTIGTTHALRTQLPDRGEGGGKTGRCQELLTAKRFLGQRYYAFFN